MGLESGTYISDLNAANPAAGDLKSQGDDHLRLIKSTIKATFPNITGAVNTSQTDLNALAGIGSGSIPSLSVANLTTTTQAVGDNSTKVASTAYVQAAILNSSGITAQLPAQAGNAGKVLTTNGSVVSWQTNSPDSGNLSFINFGGY